MLQKIAKKSLLIFLLFILTIFSIIAPMKTGIVNAVPASVSEDGSALLIGDVKNEPAKNTGDVNTCSTCFVAFERFKF